MSVLSPVWWCFGAPTEACTVLPGKRHTPVCVVVVVVTLRYLEGSLATEW